MACSIAVKRPHEFEHGGAKLSPTGGDGGVPASKKLRPCSFGGAGLNINLDKMSLASSASSSSPWKGYRTKLPMMASSSSIPCLPPPPNLKRARQTFEEVSAKCKRSDKEMVDLVYNEYARIKRRKFEPSDEVSEDTTKAVMLEEELLRSPKTPTSPQPSSSTTAGSSKLGGESPSKKENVTITIKQAVVICERLLKQQEESLCGEYEQALIEKLQEQYNAYVKFSQDQLQSNNIDHSESYIS